jgi:hypothetical protein
MMSRIATHPPRSLWKWAPVLLLGSLLSGLGAMVFIATGDPSFAVEPEYYQKALDWDREREQQASNARLGYRLGVQVEAQSAPGAARELVLRLEDATGQPIHGANVEVTAFHNARAAEIVRAKLVEQAPGSYVQRLPLVRPGLWELRVVAKRAGIRFTHVTRLELGEHGKRS